MSTAFVTPRPQRAAIAANDAPTGLSSGSVTGILDSRVLSPAEQSAAPAELPFNHPSPADLARRMAAVKEPQSPLSGREKLLIGTLALVVHGALFYWLAQRPSPELPVVPPEVPEMVIEFASPAPPPPPEPPPPEPVVEPLPPPPPPPPVVEELAVKPPPKPKPKPVPKPAPPPVPVPAPPPAPAPTPAPAPAPPITPPQASAAYLRNPAPEYPSLALRRGWEGTVLLRVHVLASGKPSEIQIQKSSGREPLDQAAVKAVRNWSFVPSKQGEKALDGWVSVPIDFKLN